MKKSKIIAPALAVLTLSTAAAVTGTVAWFTAGRVKNIAMSGITAINPESGLNATVSNVANTTVTGDDEHGWSVAHSSLRDASVDIVGDKVYGSILADDGGVTGYKEIAKGTANAQGIGYYSAGSVGGNAIYYATVFESAFTLSRDGGYPYNLFFDSVTSLSKLVTTNVGDTATTILNALRIGLAVIPGGEASVTTFWTWAPKTLEASTLKYVKAAVNAGGTLADGQGDYAAYGTPTTVDHSIKGSVALPSGEIVDDTTAQAAKGYLGALHPTNALTVRVYTWFEGLDPNCVNSATDLTEAFTAGLSFKMIRSA